METHYLDPRGRKRKRKKIRSITRDNGVTTKNAPEIEDDDASFAGAPFTETEQEDEWMESAYKIEF